VKLTFGSLFQHLHQQYDELFPELCTKFPEIFEQDMFTWDNFLWACELWYSNSMMVVLSSGKLTTCLIPVAGLMNHSVCNSVPESVQKLCSACSTKWILMLLFSCSM
jgi:hypothetical protein